MAKRPPIPTKLQTEVLLANRHACCVCQKTKVQLHHIDGDHSNNSAQNLAALCLDHHDQASMVLGLTKKLQPDAVRTYKRQWEEQCATDVRALSRDRLNYYATLYKNPPRIRELFLSLSPIARHDAVATVMTLIADENAAKGEDKAFDFQMTPKKNNMTRMALLAAASGEVWPSFLHRVAGHPEDPDLPIDLGPPHGMTSFHGFDLYCQILMQIVSAAQPPLPLEDLYEYDDVDEVDAASGRLLVFRESATGKGVYSPRGWREHPTGKITLRKRSHGRKYETVMQIKNMYVFSDTSAENLKQSRVCGVALMGGAQVHEDKVEINAIPLLIGMGGLGQSSHGGWAWKLT